LAHFEVIIPHSPGWITKTSKELRITAVIFEIRITYFPNTDWMHKHLQAVPCQWHTVGKFKRRVYGGKYFFK